MTRRAPATTAIRIAVATAIVVTAATGCSLVTDSFVTNEFSGDAFPIHVDTQHGGIVLGARDSFGTELIAVIDVLSPLTVFDHGPGRVPSISSTDLTLLGQRGLGGPLDVPRARLPSSRLLALHPCDEDSPTCEIGTAAGVRGFDAIIGADALAGDALRLRLGDDQVFLLADIGGTELDRTRACDAVFPTPFRGGGTMIVARTELPFSGRRIALSACLGANPDAAVPQGQRGADALLVVSSSIGMTILGEAAYERYRQARAGAPPEVSTLAEATVWLPSGPITGRRGALDSLALVAATSSNPRAACRQVWGSQLMLQRDCTTGDDCPCEVGKTFCGVPAIHLLEPPTELAVLIVPDSTAVLQALRIELRDQPDVDGILGTDALRTTELDIDYPHDRVLARCAGDGCTTRPALSDVADRTQVQGCLPAGAIGPIL